MASGFFDRELANDRNKSAKISYTINGFLMLKIITTIYQLKKP
jgi:hypothetical protein